MTNIFRQMLLTPKDSEAVINDGDLLNILRQIGLIGNELDSTNGRQFCVGSYFLQHISFMGCAPAIEFDTSKDQFTYIHLPEAFRQPLWQADLNMARPACPVCKKRISGPGRSIDQQNQQLTCPHCGETSCLCEYDWREFGGCSRTMISIVNVYPKEAIPSDNLLNQLAELTDTAWRYYYIHACLP